MLQTYNEKIVDAASMGATVTSTPIYLYQIVLFAVQAVWTGAPVGNFTIEVSSDLGTDQLGTGVTNWDTYTGSTVAAGGSASSFTWNVDASAFKWARLKYTRTSGTGTLNARANCKGI